MDCAQGPALIMNLKFNIKLLFAKITENNCSKISIPFEQQQQKKIIVIKKNDDLTTSIFMLTYTYEFKEVNNFFFSKGYFY